MKSKLATAPIVQFPDYKKPFHLHTDASEAGIGAALMQEKNGLLHPVAYVSKTLNAAQRKYTATKREALALVFALEQFRHIILMFPIKVYTDHQALLGALTKPTKDECIQRWAMLIQESAIDLRYLEGKKNIFADTLSRLPEPESLDLNKQFQHELDARNSFCNWINDEYPSCFVIHKHITKPKSLRDDEPDACNSSCNSINEYLPVKLPWGEDDLRNAQQKDVSCMNIIKSLSNKEGDEKVPAKIILDSRVINGVLYIVRRIKRAALYDVFLVPYIPDSMMNDALKLTHEDLIAGHKGPERTLKLFIINFYNGREKAIINQYCRRCEICIRAKGIPKPVPIKTYPIPTRPFHTLTSDIIGPLRITESGNQFILTFRDYVTRFTILLPMPHKTTDNIINGLRQVISTHGSPNVLLTDNAKEYTSNQLKSFLHYYNTRKVEVAPYHPSSAGFSERINREVNKLLRMFVNQLAINDWDQLLPVVQLCINNTFNASLKETPFYALYGYDGASIALNPPRFSYREDGLTQHMQRVTQIRAFCRKSLLQAQSSYTESANKGRKEKQIKVGSRVFARTDKHQPQEKRKLDLPISGPFIVIASTGKAWTLEEISTGNRYVVHADYIVGRSITDEPIEPQPSEATHAGEHSSLTQNEPTPTHDEEHQPLLHVKSHPIESTTDLTTTNSQQQEPIGETQPPNTANNEPKPDIRKQPHRACKNNTKAHT